MQIQENGGAEPNENAPGDRQQHDALPGSERISLGAYSNMAVLPDVMWVEAYKSRRLEAIVETLSIVGEYPDQAVVLKSSGEIAMLDPAFGMAESTMSNDGEQDLRGMMDALALARTGEPGVLEQLEAQWSQATSLMQGMLEGAAEILETLPEMAETYTADEIRRFRTSGSFTAAMLGKIFGSAEQICETLFVSYGREPPSDPRLRFDTYLYRLSLGIMVYMIWWVRNGSQVPNRHDRARNDFIDLSFAVHATYFDGLMTEDAKASWMYTQLCGALRLIQASV